MGLIRTETAQDQEEICAGLNNLKVTLRNFNIFYLGLTICSKMKIFFMEKAYFKK